MKNKLSACLLIPALLIGVGTTAEIHTVSAKSASDVQKEIDDLNKKKSNIREQKANLSGNKKDTEAKLNENESKQETVEKQLSELEEELGKTFKKINDKKKSITKTNEQIKKLETEIRKLHDEIEVLKDKIKKREEILKDRMKSIQESGGTIKYLEVLMGSQDIGDFISRSTAVGTIMDQDKTIMEELEADKKKLQSKKKSVENKKSEEKNKKEKLVAQKKDLDHLKASLDDQKSEKDKLMASLEQEHKHLEEFKVSIDDEQRILAAQEEAVHKAISLAEGKKGEIERQAREAEEQAARSSQHQTSASTSSSSGTSSYSGSVPSTGGSAKFSWPASGALSSGYGHRWGTLHAGLDIANVIGTPVKAAAPGVVISTNTPNDGQMNGYGNVVLIAHSMGGTTYTTLYAHMSKISVSAGQHVDTGDLVGAIGNTGQSTGPHLHFEVHHGGWNAAKSNSIDPATVLP
ncbi:peptidoglycan DD-metalloendopeptidase family protein [Aciduricibacillus chroicocephali]|uniref:Peptidoglycan DD-metalloendopeptidase family protein n=1 Tax=Aciduricibacillus chroicocephali TaxID=3054939 RepID=A0ABY9KT12_9BACI|nr:peptidoglycan DD-metalloendopeptidase family protein [Bacillaceae bacterium 44XB]